ncbi:hypothetical protein [Bizionia paragorgiae]|uniref:hypothetical protein n=1 Tax=Bizionia paragorgiae TaxID=283786 RepID=UPI003A8CC022
MDLAKIVIDHCKDKNGNICITPDALRMLLASQRQDIKKKIIRREEVIELLALNDSRALTTLLNDPNCRIEKALLPNTFTISSVLREQERQVNFK